MGLLDGGLQRVALGAFGSLLLKAKIKPAPVETRDGKGRIIPGDPGTGLDCRAFFDKVTDAMRANGYENRDVQIICLQLTPQGVQIGKPVDGGRIVFDASGTFPGGAYRIANPIDQDPAMAAWTFRATPE
jgi:hypothetical protein